MPIMDGKKLIRWIKSSPKLHNVPIVVITSAGNDAKRVELKNMGVEEVIHKPLNLRDLKQVICPKYVKDLFDQDQSKAAPCTYCGCHLCRQ